MRPKICFIVSAPMTAQFFLRDHIKALSQKYDIYLVANGGKDYRLEIEGIKGWYSVDIQRGISPLTDIKSIVRLWKYFSCMKFDAVHSVTPKAGMVTSIAAKLAGITSRIHIYTGQVWATRRNLSRFVLKSIDKLISVLNNYSLVDGEGQREFLIAQGIITPDQSRVLGKGSISGVNTERFFPSPIIKTQVRESLGIKKDKIVFCLMGRFNKEKGIYELFEAFNNIVIYCPNAYLFLIGMDEENCLKHLGQYKNIIEDDNYKFFGKTTQPERILQAADIFCMPSYREGFGSSVIEAQCLGIPVICSDIYGLKDAMVDNETGLRCSVGDSKSLEDRMSQLYRDSILREKLGNAGRERVLKYFSGEEITSHWVNFYDAIL